MKENRNWVDLHFSNSFLEGKLILPKTVWNSGTGTVLFGF
jgi:hypothetical protein